MITLPREALDREQLAAYLQELHAAPPAPFSTWEEYNEYRSWRIEVQMIATYLNDWKQSKPEDKGKCVPQIQMALDMANKRATKFPMIDLPTDILDPVASASGLLAPTATEAHLNIPVMIQELTSLFGNVQLVAGTPMETS